MKMKGNQKRLYSESTCKVRATKSSTLLLNLYCLTYENSNFFLDNEIIKLKKHYEVEFYLEHTRNFVHQIHTIPTPQSQAATGNNMELYSTKAQTFCWT